MAIIPIDLAVDPEDDRALQAWVEVLIDDAPVRILLDTGSERSAVPAASVTAPPKASASDGRGVSGEVDHTMTSVLDRVMIGGVLGLRDLPVDVQPDGWPHPAHLGRQVFANRPCHLRFTDGEIETDALRPLTATAAGSAWHRSGPAAVVLRWPQTAVSAVFDTGAGITVVDQGWASDYPDAVIVTEVADSGTDVTGSPVAARHGRLRPSAIADLQFPEQECGVVDLSGLNQHLAEPISMILGLPQIAQARWFIDPETNALLID